MSEEDSSPLHLQKKNQRQNITAGIFEFQAPPTGLVAFRRVKTFFFFPSVLHSISASIHHRQEMASDRINVHPGELSPWRVWRSGHERPHPLPTEETATDQSSSGAFLSRCCSFTLLKPSESGPGFLAHQDCAKIQLVGQKTRTGSKLGWDKGEKIKAKVKRFEQDKK